MLNIKLENIFPKHKMKTVFNAIGDIVAWNLFVLDRNGKIIHKQLRKDYLTKTFFSGKSRNDSIQEILSFFLTKQYLHNQNPWFICEQDGISFGCVPLKANNRKLGYFLGGPFLLSNDKQKWAESKYLLERISPSNLDMLLQKIKLGSPEDILNFLKNIRNILRYMVNSNYNEYLVHHKYQQVVDKSYRELQEKNLELEEAITKLKELDQLKADFLSNVSHELRTPLTPIIAYTELLQEEELGSTQREYLDIILENSEHLYELIRDLLTITKLESGKVKLFLTNLYFPVILIKSIETVRHIADQKNVLITTDYPAHIPLVIADETRLQQILNNLINNAVKFTPENGKIIISVGQLEKYPAGVLKKKEKQKYQTKDMLKISVSDTGIGIPSDKINSIFDRFHQLDGSSTREYSGVGLGLNIVKNLVELQDGKI